MDADLLHDAGRNSELPENWMGLARSRKPLALAAADLRIGRGKVCRRAMNAGEVAASSTRDENLAAGLRVMFEQSDAAAARASDCGVHKSGGPRIEDHYVEAAWSRWSSFDRLGHNSILSET